MKIKEMFGEYDCRCSLEIEVDGKMVFLVCDGEPEDSNLQRDFSDCYKVIDLMLMAYNAGKNGEEFTLEQENNLEV